MPYLPTTTCSRLSLAVRRSLFAGLLCTSPLLLALPAVPADASEQTHSYAIPAGGLDQAGPLLGAEQMGQPALAVVEMLDGDDDVGGHRSAHYT